MNPLFPAYLGPRSSSGPPEPPVGTLPSPDEVLSLLGYRQHQITDALRSLVRTDLRPSEQQRVLQILEELAATDAAIKDAIADSGITKTCNSEINWAKQIRLLRQQGQELLMELARIYDVEIAYSRFAVARSKNILIQYQ